MNSEQKTGKVSIHVPSSIVQTMTRLVDSPGSDGACVRPRIKLDINKTTQDVLYISEIPKEMTVNVLHDLVESFGKIQTFEWQHDKKYTCEVVYKDINVAHEAQRKLDGSKVTGGKLKAVLRARPTTAQLFVGDLIPSVDEAMLEKAFENLVGSKVKATLKRDTNTFSPIGYGFLRFQNEQAASIALLRGNRMRIGSAVVRVGRAERNCYLYVTDLSPEVTINDIRAEFENHGDLVEEDTVLIRRAHVSIQVSDLRRAEMCKMVLDHTPLKGRTTLSYDGSEGRQKGRIVVMFPSSATKPPQSLRELVLGTFSKYGSCQVEVPYLRSGYWKRCAIVTFLGEGMALELAAIDAIQNVTHVSQYRVMCNWAQHVLPNRPPTPARTNQNVKGISVSPTFAQKTVNDQGFTTPVKENGAVKPHVSFGSVMICPSSHWSASYSPYSPVVPVSDSGTGINHGSLESNAQSVHPITSLSQPVPGDSPPAGMSPSCKVDASSVVPAQQNSDASAQNNPIQKVTNGIENSSVQDSVPSQSNNNTANETRANEYSVVYMPSHVVGYMQDRNQIPDNWVVLPQPSMIPQPYYMGQQQQGPA